MGFVKISYAFQQCKNVEHPLRFDKVTDSYKVGTFLRHSVCMRFEDTLLKRIFLKTLN